MLFVDIETVSSYQHFDEVPDRIRELWSVKCVSFNRNIGEPEPDHILYEAKAGIFAEFAKIVCISVGYLSFEGDEVVKCKIKSFAGDDEKKILQDFSDLLSAHFNDPEKNSICGHNIKEFDIPFICRRMVIHKIPFPKLLDLSGKKPWQTQHIWDTMDMWRFGDYKNYTSLSLLSAALGIDTPKDDIDGSQVGKVYWEEKNVHRISIYCQKDVLTVIQVMLAYAGHSSIGPEKVELNNL